MIVQELAYKVTLQADEFLNGKRKVVRETEDLEKKTKGPLAKISKGFGDTTKGVIQFGKASEKAFDKAHSSLAKYLGIALSLEGARRLFVSTTKSLVDLGNTSSFLDMNAKSLEGFTRAAEASGVSGQAMTSMLMRLKNAQNWSKTGWGAPDESTIAMMQVEGMTGEKIIGAKDPGEALLAQARALRQMDKPMAEQAWQRMGGQADMFGLMYTGDLATLQKKFEQGSDASKKAIEQARGVNKALQALDQTVDNLGKNMVEIFGDEVIEGMKQFSDWITNNKDDIIGFFRDGADWAEKFSEAVGGSTNALILLVGMRAGPVGALASLAYVTGNNELLKEHKEGKDGSGISPVETDGSWYGAARHAVRLKLGAEAAQKMDDVAQMVMPSLLDSIQEVESGGDPNVTSPKGATGSFQFMAPTARELGLRVDGQVDERKDPEKARAAAGIYMTSLLNRYKGNVTDALMAYNWGMGNMDKWIKRGRPDKWVNEKGETVGVPQETRDYPTKVAKYYQDQANQASMPQGWAGATDNSQTSSSYMTIQNMTVVASNPDQLGKQLMEMQRRGQTVQTFASANQ